MALNGKSKNTFEKFIREFVKQFPDAAAYRVILLHLVFEAGARSAKGEKDFEFLKVKPASKQLPRKIRRKPF